MITKKQIKLFTERFAIQPNGCWDWTWNKDKDKDGYGLFHARPHQKAHRFSYEMFKGEFDKSLYVCHTCDNPSCVNPDHLWLGTVKDNNNDTLTKNRHAKQKRNNYCMRGHEFTEENTLKNPARKHRTCKKCFYANRKKK